MVEWTKRFASGIIGVIALIIVLLNKNLAHIFLMSNTFFF